MRTTLTLDDDVAASLKREMRRSGSSLKETVNQVMRRGFMASQEKTQPRPFVITPRNLGVPHGYDKVEELLEVLEGDLYR